MMSAVIPARLEFQCGHAALVSLPRVKGESVGQRNDRIAREKSAAQVRSCDFCPPVTEVVVSAQANGTDAIVAEAFAEHQAAPELQAVADFQEEAELRAVAQAEAVAEAEAVVAEAIAAEATAAVVTQPGAVAEAEAVVAEVEAVAAEAEALAELQAVAEVVEAVAEAEAVAELEAVVAAEEAFVTAAQQPALPATRRRVGRPRRQATALAAAPNGRAVAPNGRAVAPNGRAAAPNGRAAAPTGFRFVVRFRTEAVLQATDIRDALRQAESLGATEVLAVSRA